MDKYMNANIAFSKFSRDYMTLKKDMPIRPSEMGLLNIITRREGDVTPLMIAELLGVSKPMVAAHIRALLKKGYICKESSGVDKRSFFVRPTEKGEALVKEFEAEQTEYLKTIEARLGEAKFDMLVCLLNETQAILDDELNICHK